jgi:hypothetical protein
VNSPDRFDGFEQCVAVPPEFASQPFSIMFSTMFWHAG